MWMKGAFQVPSLYVNSIGHSCCIIIMCIVLNWIVLISSILIIVMVVDGFYNLATVFFSSSSLYGLWLTVVSQVGAHTVKNFRALGAPNWCCAQPQWTPKFGAHSLHLICEYKFSFVCGVMKQLFHPEYHLRVVNITSASTMQYTVSAFTTPHRTALIFLQCTKPVSTCVTFIGTGRGHIVAGCLYPSPMYRDIV